MNFHTKVVTKRTHDLLNLLCKLTGGSKDQGLALNQTIVKLLQDSRTEGSSLSCSRLRLLNNIKALAERNNTPLLDG
jgi:hypothetical protein